VAVPTTAGTGSEVQSFALISQDDTHRKMACGDPSAAPRLAVLDPTLTLSQPARVTACTGLDALGHALETWVSTARTPAGCLFSAEAFQLINAALPRVLSHPGDLEARGVMLLAAAFAGIAIENGMLGAAHAMANPLTAHHDIPHGLAVALVLPAVIRWNGEDPATADRYGQLARAAALVPPEAKTDVAVEALALRVLELISLAGYGDSLAANGVAGSSRSRLAADAATQWTGGFNPRPVGEAEFQRLLDAAGCPHA
jgi:alcohol dehydrogenase